jgi:phage-related protein
VSLTIGELVATADLDDSGMISGLASSEAGLHHLAVTAVSAGEQIHRGLEEATSELPEVVVDADTTPADRELHALRQRLEVMSSLEIGVDVDQAAAERDITELRDRLTVLSGMHPDVTVQAQVEHAITALDATLAAAAAVGAADPTVTVDAHTVAATTGLAHVAAAATAVGHMDPHVDVHVDDHGSSRGVISRLGSLMASAWSAASSVLGFLKWPAIIGAGIPIIAGLISTLVNIAPAAAIGATAILSVASAAAAIKIGTSGIGDALKAAFAPATGGGGAAAKATNQVADAQRNLQRATENAAYANKQAAQQTAVAERDLATAQRAALAAQAAINDARHQAVRDLEDMNNSLIDAQNASADAQNAVEDAAAALTAAQTTGDPEAISRAQLAYNEAVQALKEQQLQVQRLTVDTAAADKAGVEGSKGVQDAKANEAQAVQDVHDKTLALANAQEQQARTAQQGADAILQAKEALAQAGAAGGGAAGGVNAFAQAMAKLAPNARAFVREVISLKPAWDGLKLDVQQRLFAGMAGALAATAAVALPVFRRGLDDSAVALNHMGLDVLSAARNLAADGTLGKALAGASAGLSNLSHVPSLVVTAFGQLAAAAAPQFDNLTSVIADKAQGLSDRLTAAFKSGGMADAINHAVDLIKQIGGILGDVGSIIGSVMSAAQNAGGGWLGVLKDISGALKTAFASPEVQAGLSALFDTMAVLGQTVAPLVVQALGVIAPVLAALGPPTQVLVKTLGAAIGPLIKALGPVLLAAANAVGALVVALSPLLPVIDDLIAQLLPVLTPVLDLLTSMFIDMAGPIRQIATALDKALTPVIGGLIKVVQLLVDQYLGVFTGLINDMIPLIPQLTPVLIQLGISLGQILMAVAPLLPQLIGLSLIFITQMLPALLPLLPPLLQLTTMLLELATGAIVKIVIPALSGLIKFLGLMMTPFKLAADAVHWLTTTIAGAFEWLYDHLVGHSVIPDTVRGIVSWFAGLPGKAIAALGNIAARLGQIMVDATNRMINATSAGLRAVVSWISDLPGRALRALGDLGSYLYKSGQALLRGFANGIRSMANVVGDAAGSVLDFAKGFFPNSPAKRGPFSGPGWTFHSGVATATDYGDGLLSRQQHVARAAAALLGSASGAFGANMGGAAASLAIAGAAGGNGGGAQTLRVVVDVQGGTDPFARAIREVVKIKGGGGPDSVQRAFGG